MVSGLPAFFGFQIENYVFKGFFVLLICL